MASLCIHNAKVVRGTIASGGVLIEDGRIAACLRGSDRASADVVIDAGSRLLFPGFVDAHVHMRDPGQPHKEDFGSGSAAAAVGGITTVMCMPNTRPPLDSLSGFDEAWKAGESRSFVDFALQAAVHPSNQHAMAALGTQEWCPSRPCSPTGQWARLMSMPRCSCTCWRRRRRSGPASACLLETRR